MALLKDNLLPCCHLRGELPYRRSPVLLLSCAQSLLSRSFRFGSQPMAAVSLVLRLYHDRHGLCAENAHCTRLFWWERQADIRGKGYKARDEEAGDVEM